MWHMGHAQAARRVIIWEAPVGIKQERPLETLEAEALSPEQKVSFPASRSRIRLTPLRDNFMLLEHLNQGLMHLTPQ